MNSTRIGQISVRIHQAVKLVNYFMRDWVKYDHSNFSNPMNGWLKTSCFNINNR